MPQYRNLGWRRTRSSERGGVKDEGRTTLGRWAVTCYALVFLSLVHTSSRTDFVQNWLEQKWYQEAVTDRIAEIDNLLRAFRTDSPAFTVFATGTFVMVTHYDCRWDQHFKANVACPDAGNLSWRVGENEAYTLESHGDHASETVRFTEELAELVHQYRGADELQRAPIRASMLALLNNYPRQRKVISTDRLLSFIEAFREFRDSADTRREVAQWGLDGAPPIQLMSLKYGRGASNPLGVNFSDIQPGRIGSNFEHFRSYVEITIQTHHNSPALYDRIAALRESWAAQRFSGKGEQESVRLNLAGVQATLLQLARLLPLALLGAFAIFSVTYINWLRARGKDTVEREFPVFGHSLEGYPLSLSSTLSYLGWILHAALPVSVLTVLSLFVTWPLTYGFGSFFHDEHCRWASGLQDTIYIGLRCGGNGWPATTAALLTLLLILWILRTEHRCVEITQDARAKWWRMAALALGWLVAAGTAAILLKPFPEGFPLDIVMFVKGTLNYWIPLFMMVLILLVSGRRGAFFSLAAVVALTLPVPRDARELVRSDYRDVGAGAESCYGLEC